MKQRPFFYHRQLGYRCNPFGALTADEWMAVAFFPAAVAEILSHGFVHLQLTGRKGCGKTATLLKLVSYYQEQGRQVTYEYLPEGQTHFEAKLETLDVFVLDEAQRLHKQQRRRWLAQATAVKLVFSSHEDLAAEFARHHLPLVTVRLDEDISVAHYQTWIKQRLDYFALPSGPRVTLTSGAVRFLHQTFGCDMREAEYFLYEVFQQEWEEGEIGAEALQRYRFNEGSV